MSTHTTTGRVTRPIAPEVQSTSLWHPLQGRGPAHGRGCRWTPALGIEPASCGCRRPAPLPQSVPRTGRVHPCWGWKAAAGQRLSLPVDVALTLQRVSVLEVCRAGGSDNGATPSRRAKAGGRTWWKGCRAPPSAWSRPVTTALWGSSVCQGRSAANPPGQRRGGLGLGQGFESAPPGRRPVWPARGPHWAGPSTTTPGCPSDSSTASRRPWAWAGVRAAPPGRRPVWPARGTPHRRLRQAARPIRRQHDPRRGHHRPERPGFGALSRRRLYQPSRLFV